MDENLEKIKRSINESGLDNDEKMARTNWLIDAIKQWVTDKGGTNKTELMVEELKELSLEDRAKALENILSE